MDDIIRMKKTFKKCETTVTISGLAVIVFGLWSVIRLMVNIFYGSDREIEMIRETIEDESMGFLIIILIGVVIFVITMLFHGYVGLRALKFARGSKKKWFFLVVAVLMALITLTSVPSYFMSSETHTFDISKVRDETIAAAMVDLALVYMLIDMVVAAIRLKVLDKKLKEQEA